MSDFKVLFDATGSPVLIDPKELAEELAEEAAEPQETTPVSEEADPQPQPPEDSARSEGEAPSSDSAEEVLEDQPSQKLEDLVSAKPINVEQSEWSRREQAVRELAREFDPADKGDVKDFLKGRVKRPLSEKEIEQFLIDVQHQRAEDIIDVYDNQLRATVEQIKRSRRKVRVTAPKGWLKRALNTLSDPALDHVVAQLSSRGHSTDSIKKRVVSRVTDEARRSRLEALLPEEEGKED